MRRMIDPKEAGGSLPSAIKFDEEGNRTVGKNLGVDGKLTLKSLISASNPDGDITKELGGGGGTPMHVYTVFIKGNFGYYVHTYKDYHFTIGSSVNAYDFTTDEQYKELRVIGYYPASGCYTTAGIVVSSFIVSPNNDYSISGYDLANKESVFRTIPLKQLEVAITQLI